ncbi:hypothetical protein CFAM422_002837 [Trichoderma lentiforme]|uniref:Uncharacterized protein n=1 Tax=Trichoderma lentiforme TaxID=1567552 RepID=A0A9P5CEQ9_9HYPO|nr:hypothetical protein CFAM422_002837 [Trichoderma lentiforme]
MPTAELTLQGFIVRTDSVVHNPWALQEYLISCRDAMFAPILSQGGHDGIPGHVALASSQ